jgi:hypothetical protein
MKMLRSASYPVTLQFEMKSSGNYSTVETSETGGAEVTLELLEVPVYEKPADSAASSGSPSEDSAATI